MSPETTDAAAPLGEITSLLHAWSMGNEETLAELITVVYPRLQAITGAMVAREWGDEIPQRTVPVHELYLKLRPEQDFLGLQRALERLETKIRGWRER